MKPQLWAISITVILTLAFSITVTVVQSLVLENDSETDMPCYGTNANRINRIQPGQEQYCDANTPCESGECYKFEDEETPICFEGDPCSRCPSGKCNIAESYPMQVFCIDEDEVITFPGTWLILGVIAVGVVAVLVLSMKRMRIR
ncbi:MAG: hypothetical protein ACFFCW_43030 [Candidatus Hodarchaeota archaeon]